VQALAKLVDEVFVVVPHSGGTEPALEIRENVTIYRFQYGLFGKGKLAFGAGILANVKKNPLLIFQTPLLVTQMIRTAVPLSQKVDVYHSQWLLSGIAGAVIGFITKRLHMLTVRGSDMKLISNSFGRYVSKTIGKLSFAVTAVSKEFVNDLEKKCGVPSHKVHFIPNGISLSSLNVNDARQFAESLRINGPYLFFSGALTPRKRVERLLDLVAHLPDHALVLCGNVSEDRYVTMLRDKMNALGIGNRVHILGDRTHEEALHLMKGASLYVTASDFEGRPNSVLEAIRAGVPILASNIPAHRELLPTECLSDKHSPSEVAAQAKRVCASRPSVTASRTWDECARDYFDLMVKAKN